MLRLCDVKEIGDKSYRCYFQLTLGVLAGKWKPVILYHLALMGVLRFGELKRSIPDSTDRMLSRHLRELEADGLIHREVYRQVPPQGGIQPHRAGSFPDARSSGHAPVGGGLRTPPGRRGQVRSRLLRTARAARIVAQMSGASGN